MKTEPRLMLTAAVGIAIALGGCSQESKPTAPESPASNAVNLIPKTGLDGLVPFLRENSPTDDPTEAWKVADGMLHITGKGMGYLRTETEFGDYHLTVEYKWGEFTHPDHGLNVRDSGVFLHASGNDGEFRDSWVSSFEAQMIEGRAGDIIVIAAIDRSTGKKSPHSLTAEVEEITITDRPSDFKHVPGAEARSLPLPRLERVRIFRNPHDDDWKDEKGYRSPSEIENPAGEWNTLEVIAKGDTLEISVNGKTVNRATGVTPTRGHLCLQSELSECWVRKWEVRPLK